MNELMACLGESVALDFSHIICQTNLEEGAFLKDQRGERREQRIKTRRQEKCRKGVIDFSG